MGTVMPGSKPMANRYEAIRNSAGNTVVFRDRHTGEVLSFDELVNRSDARKMSATDPELWDIAKGIAGQGAGLGMGALMAPRSNLLTQGRAPVAPSAVEGMQNYGPPAAPTGPDASLEGMRNYGNPAVSAPEIPPPPPGRAPMPTVPGVPPVAQPGIDWGKWGKVAAGVGGVGAAVAAKYAGNGQDPVQAGIARAGQAAAGQLPQEPGFTPGLGAAALGAAAPAMAHGVNGAMSWLASQPTPPTKHHPGTPRGNGSHPHGQGMPPQQTAGAGGQNQPTGHQVGVPMQPQPGGGMRPAANYYSEMLNAADSNDAYYRDFINLREQARQHAIAQRSTGERAMFVPVMDYKANAMHIVNANGQDVVLDMNNEHDRAEYGRMVNKIGMDPASVQDWAYRSSRPLLRHMQPPGGHADVMPDFNRQTRQPDMTPPNQERHQPGMSQQGAPAGNRIPSLDFGPAPEPVVQARPWQPAPNSIRSLAEGPAPATVPQPRYPDAQLTPSQSVGQALRGSTSTQEDAQRLGTWDYDNEELRGQPENDLDPLQARLGADLAKKAAQPVRYQPRAASRSYAGSR